MSRLTRIPHRFLALAAVIVFTSSSPAVEPDAALKTILSVSREGTNNEATASAWKQLVATGSDALIPTLNAFDGATPTAANWLRSAISAIVDHDRLAKKPLPAAKLQAFVKDVTRNPAARRIAYELLSEADQASSTTLLKTLTNDPSLELRNDAIAACLKDAKAEKDKAKQVAMYKELFAMTRDVDQAEEVAKLLEAAGAPANLTTHFNYVTEWSVIGPFDSKEGSGFNKSYAPESKVDLKATAQGKLKDPLKWTPVMSDAKYGTIDLNKAIGKHMDVVAYGYSVIESPGEMPAEIRVTTPNAMQIYLNGKKLFEREEYHHGSKMDQHIGLGTLKAGRNELLIKVCQNNQTDAWAQAWTFAVRVCDKTGGVLPLKQVVETPTGETKLAPLGNLKPAAPATKKEGKK